MNNGVSEDLNRVITWQFDKAESLVSIIEMLKKFCSESTEKFWDDIVRDVYNIETANSFGLSVWGRVVSVDRPTIKTTITRTDPNVFYSDETGIMTRVDEPFPYYSRTGEAGFFFGSDKYFLVPEVYANGLYSWYVWDSDRRDGFIPSNAVAFKLKISYPSDVIEFTNFKIEETTKTVTLSHEVTEDILSECSDELYRKVLIGTVSLLCGNKNLGIAGNSSPSDFQRSADFVFGEGLSIVDGGDMTMHSELTGTLSGEELALYNSVGDGIFSFPAGVRDNDIIGKMLAIPDEENMDVYHTSLTSSAAANNPLAGKLDESTFNWNEEHLEVE